MVILAQYVELIVDTEHYSTSMCARICLFVLSGESRAESSTSERAYTTLLIIAHFLCFYFIFVPLGVYFERKFCYRLTWPSR